MFNMGTLVRWGLGLDFHRRIMYTIHNTMTGSVEQFTTGPAVFLSR